MRFGGTVLDIDNVRVIGPPTRSARLIQRRQTMLGVSPYIAFTGNCREAIELYKCALDAEVLFTQTVGESRMPDMGPGENIMHCTIKVGDSTIMMCDDPTLETAAIGGHIS